MYDIIALPSLYKNFAPQFKKTGKTQMMRGCYGAHKSDFLRR